MTRAYDVRRSRVCTMDASQKYASDESVDNRYMNEANGETLQETA